ncbi:hypothetical protein DDD_1668 [Nonlabens dokdonensis DSW-6]|uniref:Uncharacterized protein n=1 Tax=Nonlabens dokdonensis (strain DSM 17205 / KCTC 12402 / DSW-6) TaxID=592029 RepID=L7W593_NONDD|nr:hypothetical protein DDD_1668 [Nonlabens dokdonensis DSW-6]
MVYNIYGNLLWHRNDSKYYYYYLHFSFWSFNSYNIDSEKYRDKK